MDRLPLKLHLLK